jgi:hypothetical protein
MMPFAVHMCLLEILLAKQSCSYKI